jgi:ABC-2 type transport system permease protein
VRTLAAAAPSSPRQRSATNFARVFFVGGTYAYRALFAWASPYAYVPIVLAQPIFQIVFFAYLGRAAHLEDDTFFVVGNGLQAISLPTIFGMLFTLDGERRGHTLMPLLATPANRVALVLGRSLPHMLNGIVVGTWGLVMGSVVLDTSIDVAAAGPLAAAIATAVVSCVGCGLVVGSLSLRYRNGIALGNGVSAFLLVCSGANIPRRSLPTAFRWIGDGLPLTHAIEAARRGVAGAELSSVASLLGVELLVGATYGAVGFLLIRVFERAGRRTASLDVA